MEILRPMPQEMPGIVVVQHLDPSHKSHLAPLLAKKTGKQVKEAEHGEAILPGVIYIAPPDEHLHEAGGATMAQDPATAEFRIMPQAAIDTGCVEFIVPIQELGEALVMLCRGERPQS